MEKTLSSVESDEILTEREEERFKAAQERAEKYRGCEYATVGGCPAYRGSLTMIRDHRPAFYDSFHCMDKVKCKECGVHKLIEENKEYRKKYLENCFDADDI